MKGGGQGYLYLKKSCNLNVHFACEYNVWKLMLFGKVAASELTLKHSTSWPCLQAVSWGFSNAVWET